MTTRCAALLVLPLILCVPIGCGSSRVAPVSGRILINGNPVANASVTFAPVGNKDNQEPGPSSAGTTDSNGRYTLRLIGQDGRGAIIGKHKVRIALNEETDTTNDEPDKFKQLPLKYNGQTILEFDVPAGGTDSADFDLKVP